MGSGSDPVGNGLVASLARPGGNTTGMSNQAEALVRKLLDLAREAFPVAKRVAVMINETSPTAPTFWRETEAASRASGLVPLRTVVRRPEEIDEAIGSLSARRADALVVLPDPVYAAEHAAIDQQLADAAIYQRDPQGAAQLHARHTAIDDELLAAMEREEALKARAG
jgi:putative ABC transport system substrate-binding protein